MDRGLVLPPGLLAQPIHRAPKTSSLPSDFDPYGNRDTLVREGIWLSKYARLELRVWNSNVNVTRVTLRVGLLLENGEISFHDFYLTIGSTRAENSTTFNVGVGWLVSAMIFESSGKSKRGQTYAILHLFDAITNLHSMHLIADYVYDPYHAVWPYQTLKSPTEGQGFLRVIVGTDPAAGVEVSETVPTGARWRYIGLLVTYVSSAVAGNRQSDLVLDDGANIFYQVTPSANEAVSTTYQLKYGPQDSRAIPDYTGFTINTAKEFLISAGFRIKTKTFGLDVGDNYGPPTYMVEEWIEP